MLLNKLFADRRLSYLENTNRFMIMLGRLPLIGGFFRKSMNKKLYKDICGALTQLAWIFIEFVKRYIYVLLMVALPSLILAATNPRIAMHKETCFVYVFFMLSTLCGSIANTTLLSMGDRDYMMVRVLRITPYMNFVGKLIFKTLLDLFLYPFSLILIGMSVENAVLLAFVTACARPVGEALAIFAFDNLSFVYNKRGLYNGTFMALFVILAYILPLLTGRVTDAWLAIVSPYFALLAFVASIVSWYILLKYRNYRDVCREALYIRREI
jgi:hypothetical protein